MACMMHGYTSQRANVRLPSREKHQLASLVVIQWGCGRPKWVILCLSQRQITDCGEQPHITRLMNTAVIVGRSSGTGHTLTDCHFPTRPSIVAGAQLVRLIPIHDDPWWRQADQMCPIPTGCVTLKRQRNGRRYTACVSFCYRRSVKLVGDERRVYSQHNTIRNRHRRNVTTSLFTWTLVGGFKHRSFDKILQQNYV